LEHHFSQDRSRSQQLLAVSDGISQTTTQRREQPGIIFCRAIGHKPRNHSVKLSPGCLG